MRDNCSFSVIIPCYNDAGYLARSIASVVPQLGTADEIIVVDDGSSDDTPAVVDALTKTHLPANVRYLRKSNGGVSSARNHGTKAATGTYVVFLDADDELLPGAIEAYRQAPPAHFYVGGHEWLRAGKTIHRMVQLPADAQSAFEAVLTKTLHVGNLSCMCIATEQARLLPFDEHLPVGEDIVFILLLLATASYTGVAHPVARVHRRTDSLRSRSTLADTESSIVMDTLFSHPLLPQEFRHFRATARARHLRTLLRAAWKAADAPLYSQAYARCRAEHPELLKLKWHVRHWLVLMKLLLIKLLLVKLPLIKLPLIKLPLIKKTLKQHDKAPGGRVDPDGRGR